MRSTFLVCRLDNGLMPPPRFNWGLRFYVYAPSGRNWHVDIGWQSCRQYEASDAEADRRGKVYVEQQKARGEWPPSFAAGPDYIGTMLNAHGLGLVVRKAEDQL